VKSARGLERFAVHNDEGAYAGSNTLTGATAFSDNSVYSEVGLKVGTHRIATLAHKMGITTPISTNPAMTIGGLTVGVTPLDMAHAYESVAHGGQRVTGTLAESNAPVGIQEVEAGGQPLPDGAHRDVNHVRTVRVLPPGVASTETSMLETVLQYGTGRAAALGQFAAGKTGTTSNYGDAWFVGWDSKYTVAVWVGYPNKLVPMTTEFNGQPVLGGTYPALIWHDFMTAALQVDRVRAENAGNPSGQGTSTGTSTGEAAPPAAGGSSPGGSGSGSGAPASPSGGGEGGSSGGRGGGQSSEHASAPASPAPSREAPSAPPPTPSAPPSSPSGGGGAGGGEAPTGGVSPGG